MRYMLLIYLDEHALNETARKECYVESTRLAQDLYANGQFLATAPLQPTSTATTVRVRDGKRLVTDGPFAETREQLGGYFLIEAQDRRPYSGGAHRHRRNPAGNRGGGIAGGSVSATVHRCERLTSVKRL